MPTTYIYKIPISTLTLNEDFVDIRYDLLSSHQYLVTQILITKCKRTNIRSLYSAIMI